MIEQFKKKHKIKHKITTLDNKLSIQDFHTYGKVVNDHFYVSSDINLKKKTFDLKLLKFSLDYWESIAKTKGTENILISPSVLNFFSITNSFFKNTSYHQLSSNEVEILKSKGVFQANSYHYAKFLVLDEETYQKKLLINDISRNIIKEIKKTEPRTELYISGNDTIFYSFDYRGTTIKLALIEKNELFYLAEEGKKVGYPFSSEDEIMESIKKILNTSYNRLRTKFVLNPPKTYFNQVFTFLSNNAQEKMYSLLLKNYNFNEIEDFCFLSKNTPHYKHSGVIFFMFLNDYYIVIDNKLIHYFDKEQSIESFEKYVLDKTSSDISLGINKMFANREVK